MATYNLTVSEVAELAGCHRNTVLRYESRGYIRPMRDVNGYRRYSKSEAQKLKEILALRKPMQHQGAVI